MISKAPLNPNRVRKITGSFSWLDHRLLHEGFVAVMEPDEMLLYFFLVLVGDRNGISFYSYDKICTLLKMEVERLLAARTGLLHKSLIAFEDGRYQVLQLPECPPHPAEASGRQRQAQRWRQDFTAFAEIVQQLAMPKQ